LGKNIHILETGSKFEPLIGNPGDGGKPSCAIIDEFHEHDSSALYDTMKFGMGARRQPLMFVITTAGDNLAGPCYDTILTGRKVLEEVIEDEKRFFIEYTIDGDDDWADPTILAKANPNFEVSVFEPYLRDRQKEGIQNPRRAGGFQTKNLNRCISSKQAYFNIYHWNECYDPEVSFDLPELSHSSCYIGLDLASKNDMAAMVLLFPQPDGRPIVLNRFYLPEKQAEDAGKVRYKAWAEQGKLTLTPGNMIDHQWIKDDLDEMIERYDVQMIVFDPSNAVWMMGKLMEEGRPVIGMTQAAQNVSEPMKHIDGLINGHRLRHGSEKNDPMTWMMSNVISKPNRKDQDFPDKERPELKIDGPVALIMAARSC
jgi:phage terminase large subunit-like protein